MKDLVGQTFNRLTVVQFAYKKHYKSYWFCKCLCGKEKEIAVCSAELRNDHTKSCGCLAIESSIKLNTTHGLSYNRLYIIYRGMITRCSRLDIKNYGGRGITVCDRWLGKDGLTNFIIDVQDSYLKHVKEFGEKNTSIDRINSDDNYELSNIQWATKIEQARNTRMSTKTIDYDAHMNVKSKIQVVFSQLAANVIKNSKYEKYFGCSIKEFKQYIESQFSEGMTWENHGRGSGTWQFDHIKGCNNFDLSKEEDVFKCFNYKNLRPMWHEDHIKKSKHLVNV